MVKITIEEVNLTPSQMEAERLRFNNLVDEDLTLFVDSLTGGFKLDKNYQAISFSESKSAHSDSALCAKPPAPCSACKLSSIAFSNSSST